MTLQEQIQIVEDNLKEYGQCNITFEEYNFLKDELYSRGCLAGIELGRAEVIDEYKKALLQAFNETNINDYGFYPQNVVDMVAIKLKEQK